MPHPGRTPAERFEMKVNRSGECHRWTAAHDGDGYGRFSYEGKWRTAHIAALLLAGIEIPDGYTVDHVWARGCKHRDCVRLDHLEPVPHRENVLRGNGLASINARMTTCLQGHPLAAPIAGSTRRPKCRACQNRRNAERFGLDAFSRQANYGHCVVCGGDYAVKLDGTLRAHNGCGGSNTTPSHTFALATA